MVKQNKKLWDCGNPVGTLGFKCGVVYDGFEGPFVCEGCAVKFSEESR